MHIKWFLLIFIGNYDVSWTEFRIPLVVARSLFEPHHLTVGYTSAILLTNRMYQVRLDFTYSVKTGLHLGLLKLGYI